MLSSRGPTNYFKIELRGMCRGPAIYRSVWQVISPSFSPLFPFCSKSGETRQYSCLRERPLKGERENLPMFSRPIQLLNIVELKQLGHFICGIYTTKYSRQHPKTSWFPVIRPTTSQRRPRLHPGRTELHLYTKRPVQVGGIVTGSYCLSLNPSM